MESHEVMITFSQFLALCGLIVSIGAIAVTIISLASKNITRKFDVLIDRVNNIELNYINDNNCTKRMGWLQKSTEEMHERQNNRYDEHQQNDIEIIKSLRESMHELEKSFNTLREEHLVRVYNHTNC